MSSRDKTQDDIELETLLDLFDTALTSNNPAMKKAIKNLLLVATLIDSELSPEQRVRGPLRRAFEDMRDLTRRMDRIESERSQKGLWQNPVTPAPVPGGPYTPSPNWIGPGNVPVPGPTWTAPGTGTGWPPGTIIAQGTGNYTLTSTTAVDDQYKADPSNISYSAMQVLEKLEAKSLGTK